MQSGEWELSGWMENPSAPGVKIEEQVYTTRLTSQATERLPVASVIFGQFYRGSSSQNIVAKDGVISGYLEQSAVAPFAAHNQSVTGTYSPTSFRIEIELPIMPGAKQVVEGRLIAPDN